MRHPSSPARPGGRPRRSWTTIAAAAVVVALAAAVTACASSGHRPASGPPGGTGSPGATIVIKNFAFSPTNLTVRPGATVTVRNEDPTTHTLTAVAPHDKDFDTGDIGANANATFTAPTNPGSYPYICLIHQFMHGTLTVS